MGADHHPTPEGTIHSALRLEALAAFALQIKGPGKENWGGWGVES